MFRIMILLLSFSSYAQNTFDPNKINKVKCYYGCKSEESSKMDALSRQCALDLCGSPSSPDSMNYTDKTFLTYIDQSKLKEFDSSISAIKNIANTILKQNNELISKFEKILKEKNGIAREFRSLDDNQKTQLIKFLFEDYIKYIRSPQKDKLVKVLAIIPSNMSESVAYGIKEYAAFKEASLNSEKKLMSYDYLYTNDDFSDYSEKKTEILKNRLNTLTKKINQFSKKTGKNESVFFDFVEDGNYPMSPLEYFNYLKTGNLYVYSERADILLGKLRESFTRQLQRSFQNKEIGKDFFDSIKYEKSKIPTSTFIAALYSLEKLDLKLLVKKLKEENNRLINEKVKEKISYCKSIYALSIIKDVSKNEKTKSLKDLNRSITELGIDFLSTKSKNFFKKEIKSALNEDLILTRDREKYKRLSAVLKSDHAKLISSYSPDSSFLKLLYLSKSAQLDPLLILENICSFGTKVYSGTFISASFDPSSGKVRLSELMLGNKYAFQSIASHEIGHLVSLKLEKEKENLSKDSLKKVKEKKSCLARSNYSEKVLQSSRYVSKNGESRFSEEDFADYIAMKTTRYNPKYGLCYLLTPSVDGENYINLNINIDGDDHAPALIRVIREAVSKYVNLSKSCEQLMDLVKEKFRFDSC